MQVLIAKARHQFDVFLWGASDLNSLLLMQGVLVHWFDSVP